MSFVLLSRPLRHRYFCTCGRIALGGRISLPEETASGLLATDSIQQNIACASCSQNSESSPARIHPSNSSTPSVEAASIANETTYGPRMNSSIPMASHSSARGTQNTQETQLRLQTIFLAIFVVWISDSRMDFSPGQGNGKKGRGRRVASYIDPYIRIAMSAGRKTDCILFRSGRPFTVRRLSFFWRASLRRTTWTDGPWLLCCWLREVCPFEVERNIDQPNHDGHFHERTDDRSECSAGVDSENGHCHRNCQFKVV